MTTSRHTSPIARIALFVTAALAALALLTALVASGGLSTGVAAASSTHTKAPVSKKASIQKQVAFHRAMDKLWEDHVTWTRLAIVSFAADLPDLSYAQTRLLQNQTDIGNAIKPFYGNAAGDRLTSLLETHIVQAVDVLQAAKAGDQTKLAAALKVWYENADQIAAFLSSANPRHWPLPEMKKMMREHLDLTTEEAVARLTGDWAGDVAAYDKVHDEILRMSDMLADGIIAQFPRDFAKGAKGR